MLSRFLRSLKKPEGLLALLFELLGYGWSDLLANFNSLSQKYQSLIGQFHLDPAMVKAGITAVFILIGLLFICSALSRRSLLLKPERFIIKADDTRHLVGREKEKDSLGRACSDNILTILKGESGAGKSALVKAGLKPKLDEDPHSRLLPLVIDASGLDWEGGLRSALAQALAACTKEQRQLIGDTAQATPAEKIFERLAKLPELAPKRLLLILDQIDDYFVAHREHFLQDGVVVKPDAVERANHDWAALAGLLRRKRLHLLLVCRKDEDMLSALHFTEPTYFPLARIEANLVSPLLEQITEAENDKDKVVVTVHSPLGARASRPPKSRPRWPRSQQKAGGTERLQVVEDPEAGWLQLKARLLRDLAEGGQVLPVRLVLALDSLRSFRYLTLAHYSKCGGARGLDRLYVEKHLQDAKHALGLDPAAVLRALVLLAEEDGSKTHRAPLADFAAALSSGPNPAEAAAPLLDFLEQNRLLRRQSGQDGDYLLLYHDYLARGVRDAYKQANRWTELLKAKSKEFDEALNWRQRWVALLSLRDQFGLVVARLRGRFNYGVYQGLAGWSLLRLGPVLMALAIALVVRWQVDMMRQKQEAASLLNRVTDTSNNNNNNYDEIRDEHEAWRNLAKLDEPARFYAVQLAISNPVIRARLAEKTDVLAHTVLNFDPDRNLSSKIAQELIPPCMHTGKVEFCLRLAKRLHLQAHSPMVSLIASAFIDRLKSDSDYYYAYIISGLGDGIDNKRSRTGTNPLAAALEEQIKSEPESYRLSELGGSLAGLDDKDPKSLATALVERIKTESDINRLTYMCWVLSRLAVKLNNNDAKLLAAELLELFKIETDLEYMTQLVHALDGLVDKLNTDDTKQLTGELVMLIQTEVDSNSPRALLRALGKLAAKLDSDDAKLLAKVLVKGMKTNTDAVRLSILGKALAELVGKLDGAIVKPAAVALVERMKTETDAQRLLSLGEALAGLADKLDGAVVEPVAVRLVECMKTSKGYDTMRLGNTLGNIVGVMNRADVKPLASALVDIIKQAGYGVLDFAEALVGLVDKLDSSDAKLIASALADRMITASSFEFSNQGEALTKLAGKLDVGDQKILAAALVNRMKTENDTFVLKELGEILGGGLADGLDSADAKQLAVRLVQLMRAETKPVFLLSLSEALAGLAGKLDNATVTRIAKALMKQMEAETEPDLQLSVCVALAHFEIHSHPENSWLGVANYVKCLRDPLAIGEQQNALLDGLGTITHQDFHGDLWQFVDWAQTEEGRKLVPRLE